MPSTGFRSLFIPSTSDPTNRWDDSSSGNTSPPRLTVLVPSQSYNVGGSNLFRELLLAHTDQITGISKEVRDLAKKLEVELLFPG